MKQKAYNTLNSLLDKNPNNKDALISLLPEEEGNKIKTPLPPVNLKVLFAPIEEKISYIHYSWLIEPLKNFPRQKTPPFC